MPNLPTGANQSIIIDPAYCDCTSCENGFHIPLSNPEINQIFEEASRGLKTLSTGEGFGGSILAYKTPGFGWNVAELPKIDFDATWDFMGSLDTAVLCEPKQTISESTFTDLDFSERAVLAGEILADIYSMSNKSGKAVFIYSGISSAGIEKLKCSMVPTDFLLIL